MPHTPHYIITPRPPWSESVTHLYRTTDKMMSSQSLSTPATFMVKADVLPMSRKTDMLRAAGHACGHPQQRGGRGGRGTASEQRIIPSVPKAHAALSSSRGMLRFRSGSFTIFGSSMYVKGRKRKTKHGGAMWYSVETGFILMPLFCSRICTSVRRTDSNRMEPTWSMTPTTTKSISPAATWSKHGENAEVSVFMVGGGRQGSYANQK